MLEWAKIVRTISKNLLPLAEKQTKLADEAFRIGQGNLQANLRSREDALREFHLARIRYQSALAE